MKNPFQSDFLSRLREGIHTQLVNHPLRVGVPILAVTGSALAAVILLTSCTVCCTVSSHGEQVAFCPDTAAFDEAVSQAETKAAAILHRPYSFDESAVSVRTTVAPKHSVEEVSAVTDSLLDAIPEIAHLYTLRVDGEQVGASEDPAVLENALREVQKRYETRGTVSTHVDNDVSISFEYVPAETDTVTEDALIEILLKEQPKVFPYIVQSGDDPVSVAENFGMTLVRLQELNPDLDLSVYTEAEAILTESQASMEAEEQARETPRAANPYAELASVAKPEPAGQKADPYAALASAGETAETETPQTVSVRDFLPNAENPIQPGRTLTVEQSCPLLEVTTVEENAFVRTLQPEREVQTDETLFSGQERIVQEGAAGYADVVARQTRRCGVLTASVDLSVKTTSEPVPVIVATGSQPIPNLEDGLFLWPVRGHISSDFGYRFIFGSTGFHRGVDIAAPMGTPICAADGGTVVFAGVRGTYGNLVVIAHPNGLYTYYGHCSALYVSEGDTVQPGDVIAAVGSTGRSTGPHCHFEVRYENASIDPLQFLPDENNAPMRLTPVAPMLMESAASSDNGISTAGTAASNVGIRVIPYTPKPSASQTGTAEETPPTVETPEEPPEDSQPSSTEEENPSTPIYSVEGPNVFDE